MSIKVLIRAVVVALIATLCSGLPIAVLLTDPASHFSAIGGYLLIALVGNLILGLPVSLLAFHLLTVESLTLSSLLMIANVVGFALVIVVTALGGAFATIFFGIPILLAPVAMFPLFNAARKPTRSHNRPELQSAKTG